MDAGRMWVGYVTVGLAAFAAGCQTTTEAKVGPHTTVTQTVPGVVRGQSPPESQPPAPVVPIGTPTSVLPALETREPVLTAPPSRAEPQVRVVAVIGADAVVTDTEVWQNVRQRAPEYMRLVGSDRSAKEKTIFKEELRRLIERELILADTIAKIKKNKPQLEDELKDAAKKEADRRIAMMSKPLRKAYDEEKQKITQVGARASRSPLANMSYDEFLKTVFSEQGLTMSGLRRQIERDSMMEMLIGQQFREKAKAITLADVRDYYDRHPAEFRNEDKLKWLDLFVSVRKFRTTEEAKAYAEALLAKALAGADFAELAKQYDQGDSGLRGGEGIGQKRGEIEPKDLEKTLFSMKAGQVSELIPASTGYHIVKVLEREVAGQRPFDEKVQAECRAKAATKVIAREKDKLIDELWRKYKPAIVED